AQGRARAGRGRRAGGSHGGPRRPRGGPGPAHRGRGGGGRARGASLRSPHSVGPGPGPHAQHRGRRRIE
ncbi:MAG: hypothetical protein EOP01_07595, partial [Propionibacteriaceae bacterium]